MINIIFLCVFFLGDFEKRLIYRSVRVRERWEIESNNLTFTESLAVRLRLFFLVITMPVKILLIKFSNNSVFVCEPLKVNSDLKSKRIIYVNSFDSRNAVFLDNRLYSDLNTTSIFLYFFIFLLALFISPSFFIVKSSDCNKIYNVIRLLSQICLLPKGACVYLYRYYTVVNYIVSLYSSYLRKDLSINTIAENTTLCSCRTTYYPRVNIVSGNCSQQYEAKYFKNRTFFFNDLVSGGAAYLGVKDRFSKSCAYDIGLYSGGFWARELDSGSRVCSIEGIREGEFFENPDYIQFLNLLDCLLKYSFERSLKLKVYLHPYERELIRDYSLYPPFIDLLIKHSIAYDFEGDSSMNSLDESRVAIASLSSVILDRWQYDLNGIVYRYQSPIAKSWVWKKALGPFSEYISTDLKEVVDKLDLLLIESA